eukprot:tig00000441_g698.t1
MSVFLSFPLRLVFSRVPTREVCRPVRLLRLTCAFIFGTCFISTLGIFWTSLDCSYIEQGSLGRRLRLSLYPEVQCWGVPNAARSITVAFVVGFFVVAYLSGLAAYARFRLLCDPDRLVLFNPESGWVWRGTLRHPHEAEIATRFVRGSAARVEMEEVLGGSPEQAANALEEALERADAIYRAGLRRFPKSAIVPLQYAGFARAFYKDPAMETTYIDRARAMELDFPGRSFIFRKLKDRESETNGAAGATMDIVSFVEFQEKFRLAREGHRRALKATRIFWTSLLERDDAEALSKASEVCRSIDSFEQQADRNYQVLIEKYPRSIRLLRAYGSFVESVKNDPAAAESYYRRADAEEEEQSRKHAGEDGQVNDGEGSIDNTVDAVIVISALGVITSANAVACRIFGYKKADLIGKRVECLMPSPFRDQHQSYIQNYQQSSVSRMINMPRELPAQHRNGVIFPIRLFVSRVDVAGRLTFVGSIRPLDNSAAAVYLKPVNETRAVVIADAQSIIRSVNRQVYTKQTRS